MLTLAFIASVHVVPEQLEIKPENLMVSPCRTIDMNYFDDFDHKIKGEVLLKGNTFTGYMQGKEVVSITAAIRAECVKVWHEEALRKELRRERTLNKAL